MDRALSLPTRCVECGKKRERCRPIIRHVDGTIDVVCPQCYRAHGYDPPPRPPGDADEA